MSINIHAGSVFGEPLVWQDVRYDPVPVECEGFEIIANGRLPRPKIRIANKDFLVTKLLQDITI
jgi:lambda family phage minor tail protein L